MRVLAAVAALLDAPSILIYAAACSVGWILTLVRPTHGALLPWLARDPTELTTAYTAAGLIESLSVLLGPLLATIFFALGAPFGVAGPGLVYAALAVLLGVGSVLIVPGSERQAPPAEPDRADVGGVPMSSVRASATSGPILGRGPSSAPSGSGPSCSGSSTS